MESSSLKDKLIRVERSINIYSKDGDELLEEISVDNIPFERLKEIVPPKEDDPLLYDGYSLEENQVKDINLYLEKQIVPNFKLFNYILVCGGIYNWS